MPHVVDIWEVYKSTEIILVVHRDESPGVTRVNGISEGQYDTIDHQNGGRTNDQKISSTKVKFEPLTIERRVDGSPEDQRFLDWWRETFHLSDNISRGSTVRKNGQIVKRHNGEPVLTFLFFDAWVKSSKFSDLEAGTDNLFTQTIVLEHEGLERVAP
jgi:phage tail-like protein